MAELILPAYIQAERRKQEEEAPSFIDLFDKAQNCWIEYYVTWHVFPRFIYLKEQVWEHAGNEELRGYVTRMKISPRPHKAIPWWVVAMHHDDIPAVEVARFYADKTAKEAVEQGYLREV